MKNNMSDGGKKPKMSYNKTKKKIPAKKGVIDMLVEGFSTPQPQSVKAIAQRVRSQAIKKMPKAKGGR